METINKLQAYSMMKMSSGRMFTATFIKKNGEVRVLNGKTKVLKAIKGEGGKGLQYNPLQKLLLPVFDMQVARKLAESEQHKAWRSINLQTLEHLRINGCEYVVI